jgi:hypothetical protein
VVPTERIAALLDEGYVTGLESLALDELRAKKAEAAAVETAVSYYRRLAQARIEILEAWSDREPEGGVEGLVADLPRILAGAAVARSSAAETRFTEPAPDIEPLDLGGREQLVVDDTLANLPVLSADDVAATLEALRAFERELSEMRRALHAVIDAVELEIATRQAADAAG